MTPGSTPRFDLYAELEVSPQATPEVIEAAYRALVKRHHPDVASPADQERIARLNVARDWLLSPARRAAYDGKATLDAPRPRPRVRREPRSEPVAPARPARTSSPESFGANSREVRQFLAELREIDGARAASLLAAKAAVDGAGYAEARDASLAVSRTARTDEWGFARDAASVIVRGKLAETPVARSVSGVVADVAGAIVVRDLLPAGQVALLLEPWTRSKLRPATEPAPAAMPLPRPRAGRPPNPFVPGRPRQLALGILGGALALLVAVAVFGGGPADPDSAVAGLTSQPSIGSGGVGDSPSPGATLIVGPGASAAGLPTLDPGLASPQPSLDAAPVGPGGTARPNAATPAPRTTPAVTPRPTAVSPSPAAQATPLPTTLPTSAPTPSPAATCTVANLVGKNSSNAQGLWNEAGFTGTVELSPQPPPQYKIGWQSLTAGSQVACTSGITLQPAAP